MKCLNNEKREELGWHSLFETYFWKKSNELVRYGLPKNRGSPEVKNVLKPTKSDFNIFKKLYSKTRKHALDSNEKVARRTVKDLRKKEEIFCVQNKPKKMVRYGKKEREHRKEGILTLEKLKKLVLEI